MNKKQLKQFVAWIWDRRSNYPLYVSNLPGEGGKDYGYDIRADKAKPLTSIQATRFKAYRRSCGDKPYSYGISPVP